MKLSLVELSAVVPGSDRSQALKDSVDAAKQAEDLGYHRVWYAEHHDAASTASSAPEILIALAASATTRIRVGSGAVLLNHYSPYKVAETFLQLEALAPGRIDLGLGRATAGPVVDLALRRDRDVPPADDFAEQVQEVLAYFHGHFPANHPFARLNPAAGVASRPDVWILAEARRLNWSRTALMARLAREGTAAQVPTVEEAERELSQDQKDIPTVITDGRWPRQLAGSPQTVRDQLEQMTKATGVDEVMVQDIIAAPAARAHSRALLAEALDVAAR
ncbi:MsnO8 family LLM class oxidoreductase [Streptomyces caniscabiei]|uniref:MsnO8 family LLM class oxidoreductase n=1 Tax=Streptomyces caniscabiei TaxID=2746961 RepID=UPI0029A788FA|nr:MsnO8 family LLM class oxidoreductase [Streptomyces caniscabiei]MDX2602630.1 MsnO8 family LLM class oxidoreductase [Streptomyces caniscabiei]MDX2734486.1 MsnO8 family LLM class oxidoreductase [Streptomyces caniscabiei]MDX2778682.1 MsnO8 family LLM class oxidoreductase [Streptomyces caniscabiei]